MTHTEFDTIYGAEKKDDLPHGSDKVGAEIREPNPGKTRGSKKRKLGTITMKDQALYVRK